jgi:hypothetical protein
MRSSWQPRPDAAALRWLTAVLVAALAVGLYGRFVGLGHWAFGVDEYYISRSIDNVLRRGIPQFLCGGLYTRGLTYQYAVAAVRLAGTPPELAARLVSALSSLLGLPAAYLLGRRLLDRRLGLLLVIALCVSVWEIETARFARMYAPFQAIFLWYLVYFVRYAVDRDDAARRTMVLLSILGVLTWEGGALLGVLNLLPPFINHDRGRLRRSDRGYLAGMLLLLVALVLATTDLRGSPPAPAPTASAAAALTVPAPGMATILSRPDWLLVWCALPAALAASTARWIASLRSRWLATGGLSIALLAALAHQFALCLGVLGISMLLKLITPSDLRSTAARRYLLTLGVAFGYWLAFGLLTGSWPDHPAHPGLLSGRWLGLIEHLCGYPHVFSEVLRPWGRAMPLLTSAAILSVLVLGVTAIHATNALKPQAAIGRTLVTVLVVLLLAVGAREPGRIETRYTFFLYPLVLAIGFATVLQAMDRAMSGSRSAAHLGALLVLVIFGLTEDFQPRHIATIASWNTNFRIGMGAVLADHYYPRADYRLVSAWLTSHIPAREMVMTDIPPLDQYYHRADYLFLPDGDDRYEDYACPRAARTTTDRWTNLPLLYGSDALGRQLASGRPVLLLLYPEEAKPMLAAGEQRDWNERVLWTSPDGGVTALQIERPAPLRSRTPAPVPTSASSRTG